MNFEILITKTIEAFFEVSKQKCDLVLAIVVIFRNCISLAFPGLNNFVTF